MTDLTFEEAMRRWSPPGSYEAMLDLRDKREFRIKAAADELRRYRLAREQLEDGIFELLRSGTVLSSAENPSGDPDRPRVLVDPASYNDHRLAYDPSGECIAGSSFRLRNVRFFSRNRVPARLEGAPYRPGGATKDAGVGGETSANRNGAVGFRHDATYRHVWIGEREFSLTPVQSGIVRELHRAALEGQPWVRVEQLRGAVGFESDKLAHLFRRMKNRRELILSDQRGYYRLHV